MLEVLISSLSQAENSQLETGNPPISNFHFVLIQSANPAPLQKAHLFEDPTFQEKMAPWKERKIKKD